MRREPDHILVQPDQQRPAFAEADIVVRPVSCAVAGGVNLAHVIRLTHWIHDVNSLPLEFRTNAVRYHTEVGYQAS